MKVPIRAGTISQRWFACYMTYSHRPQNPPVFEDRRHEPGIGETGVLSHQQQLARPDRPQLMLSDKVLMNARALPEIDQEKDPVTRCETWNWCAPTIASRIQRRGNGWQTW
jgi:hypothetical protein